MKLVSSADAFCNNFAYGTTFTPKNLSKYVVLLQLEMLPGLIHDIPTCRGLLDRIMTEAETLIRHRLDSMLKEMASV